MDFGVDLRQHDECSIILGHDVFAFMEELRQMFPISEVKAIPFDVDVASSDGPDLLQRGLYVNVNGIFFAKPLCQRIVETVIELEIRIYEVRALVKHHRDTISLDLKFDLVEKVGLPKFVRVHPYYNILL